MEMNSSKISPEEEGAVKIAIRERPIIQKSRENLQSIVAYHSTNKNIIIVNERPYEFDYCLGPHISQRELYDELVQPLVRKTLQGYFCSALAYGQTGTGKTFTMGLHSEYFSGDNVGVIPRALEDIFVLSADEGNPPDIAVSFVEIYNEKVYDLLAEDTNEQVNIKGFKFSGGVKKPIINAQEGFTVLTNGNKCRHIRPTKLNPESSRSHAIFTIHVCRKTEFSQINSLLHLVDLAGSEGVRRTGHQGVAFTEGVHINQGLLSIGKVLQALAYKRKVVPYRDSVLSSVLQDSLKANSYLTLLACISPFQEDLSETVSTLRFAADAKSLKHTPQINAILLEIKKNKMKTPQKKCLFPVRPNNIQSKTPAPLKRAFSNGMDAPLSAIKKPFHSNTFCTPSKIKRIDGKPLNQTDFGLTPKEKTRFESVERKCNAVAQNHNESIESRSSILSMNVSTSTLLDAPIVPVANSYSPIVRRCVKEIETTLGTKLEKFMDIMKEMHTIRIESSSEIKQENHSCMPNTNGVSLYSNNNGTQQHHSDGTVLDDIHHETQPFAQSSPIFKKPEWVKQPRATKSTLNEVSRPNNTFIDQTSDSTLFQTTQFGNSTVANVTVVPAPRRVSPTMFSGKDETNRPVRRSMRLEQRNSTMIAADEMKLNNRLSLSINRPKERRDSVRRSMRIQKRESIMPIEEIEEKPAVPQKRISKSVPSHNKTIAGYFKTNHENNKPKTKKQAKDAQQKHEKAVLDLLNTGTIREIQILPQVGLKTAYQIITQRTLNGKFRNFDQVSKLPVWRGKAWQRFKVANCIS